MRDVLTIASIDPSKKIKPVTSENVLSTSYVTYTMFRRQEKNKVLDKISMELDELHFKNFKPQRVIMSASVFELFLMENYSETGIIQMDTIFGIPFDVDGSPDAKDFKILCEPMVELLHRYKNEAIF